MQLKIKHYLEYHKTVEHSLFHNNLRCVLPFKERRNQLMNQLITMVFLEQLLGLSGSAKNHIALSAQKGLAM